MSWSRHARFACLLAQAGVQYRHVIKRYDERAQSTQPHVRCLKDCKRWLGCLRRLAVCERLRFVQAKWRGKAQRRAEADERLRTALYPEKADVQRN